MFFAGEEVLGLPRAELFLFLGAVDVEAAVDMGGGSCLGAVAEVGALVGAVDVDVVALACGADEEG